MKVKECKAKKCPHCIMDISWRTTKGASVCDLTKAPLDTHIDIVEMDKCPAQNENKEEPCNK